MRILLLGRTGQVGSQLLSALRPLGEVIAPGRQAAAGAGGANGTGGERGEPGVGQLGDTAHLTWDLADPAALVASVRRLAPDVIVNAAAYTAVDRAESEPGLAHAVNALAPAALAEVASETGAWLVHYSTDYVFDGSGSRPWQEADATGPLGVYGRSKLAGEQAIQARHPRHLILRTSWVHGPQGGNFIRTMLRLAGEREALSVVDDQVGAPTGAPLIAEVTARALARLQQAPQLAGLYHLAAAGETSWCGLARHALALAEAQGAALRCGPAQVRAIPSRDYPSPSPRPLNSRLDTRKLREAFGLALPAWQQGVADTVHSVLAPGAVPGDAAVAASSPTRPRS